MAKIYNEKGMKRIAEDIEAGVALSKGDCMVRLYDEKDWEIDFAIPEKFVDLLIEKHPGLEYRDFVRNLCYGYTRESIELEYPNYNHGYFLPLTPRGVEVLAEIAKFTGTEHLWGAE